MLAFAALVFAPAAARQNRLGNTELNVPATLDGGDRNSVKAGQSVPSPLYGTQAKPGTAIGKTPVMAGIGMSFD